MISKEDAKAKRNQHLSAIKNAVYIECWHCDSVETDYTRNLFLHLGDDIFLHEQGENIQIGQALFLENERWNVHFLPSFEEKMETLGLDLAEFREKIENQLAQNERELAQYRKGLK